MTNLDQLDDKQFLDLWYGENCPGCQGSLDLYGQLPTTCSTCGVDRSGDGEWWREYARRFVITRGGFVGSLLITPVRQNH
jgi:hypothetical protein